MIRFTHEQLYLFNIVGLQSRLPAPDRTTWRAREWNATVVLFLALFPRS